MNVLIINMMIIKLIINMNWWKKMI